MDWSMKSTSMRRARRSSGPLAFAMLLACAAAVGQQVPKPLQTVNKALAGIVKAASHMGAAKVCEAVVPKAFCDVIVGPVLSAVYEDYPLLQPKPNDSLQESQRKADRVIQLLQDNQRYQNMMIQALDRMGQDQDAVLAVLRDLGQSQAEVQTAVQSMLLHQIQMRQGIDELLRGQRMEQQTRWLQSRSDLSVLSYRARLLVDERAELVRRLAARGVKKPAEISDTDHDHAVLANAQRILDSPDSSDERLEATRVNLNKLILLYQSLNQGLAEDLKRASKSSP